jgi:hypothetical protein
MLAGKEMVPSRGPLPQSLDSERDAVEVLLIDAAGFVRKELDPGARPCCWVA